MEIEYLKEYLVVADELNFTHAAKRLHITQSSLSKHIATLEKELQEKLFVRSKKGLEITQAGGILYRQAISLLNIWETTHEKIAAIRAKEPIRIGGLLENNDVIVMLSRALQTYQSGTNQQILLSPDAKKPFIDQLRDNDIDLVICHRNFEGDADPDLDYVELFHAGMFAFIDSNHRLAEHDSITLQDLKDELFVHLTSPYSEYGWAAVVDACKASGFTPRSYPVEDQGLANCFILPLGDAVLVLQQGITSPGLFFANRYASIPIEDDLAQFSTCAYYRKADRSNLEGLLRALTDHSSSALDPRAINSDQQQLTQFKAVCNRIGMEFDLREAELIAMTNFAQGCSIDVLSDKLKLSRVAVGDLLASVYSKIGVHDRQDLVAFIEARIL